MADLQLARAQQRLAEGNFYEANQLYRTVFHRLLKKGEHDQAFQVACQAAVALNQHHQASSASDMAHLLLDSCKQLGLTVDDKLRGHFVDIIRSFEPAEPLRARFSEAVLKWTSKAGGGRYGDAQLHHLLGVLSGEQGDMINAQEHFSLGTAESAEELARLHFAKCLLNEREEICLRTVLEYMRLKNLRNANAYYHTFTRLCYKETPSLRTAQTTVPTSNSSDPTYEGRRPNESVDTDTPSSAERKSPTVFTNLRRHYQPAIERDPMLNMMLDQVGEIYCGVRPAGQNAPNMFGSLSNIMRMFAPAAAENS